MPQTLLLLRSLKYSAHGMEALGEAVEADEGIEVEAKRALEDGIEALETTELHVAGFAGPDCWRRWSLALVMLEKCEASAGLRTEAWTDMRRHSMPD